MCEKTEQICKHTPGPWIFYADVPSTDPDWHIVTTENRLRVIANVHIEPGNEMDAANARLIASAPKLKDALAAMLDFWGGYECPEVDAAIAVMREIGEDRWSMQAQMNADKAGAAA